MKKRQIEAVALEDVPDLQSLMREVRAHLVKVPAFFDFGSEEEPTHEIALIQLVFYVNRQNYLSVLASLESDHVLPAAQLARSLLEESIRWEWMTDDPDERMPSLIGELRRAVRNIKEECSHLPTDCEAFLNPSPFWDTSTLGPLEGARGFPSIESMLIEIQQLGDEAIKVLNAPLEFRIRRALYAQYRVLSQFTHTSVLGMTATMQRGEDTHVMVGHRLPKQLLALIAHTSTASVTNVGAYTTRVILEGAQHATWARKGYELAERMAGVAGPIHGLTTF